MLLVASGWKTAAERKSYDARLMLGGPSKCSWWRRAGKRPQTVRVMMQDSCWEVRVRGFFEMLRIAVFD